MTSVFDRSFRSHTGSYHRDVMRGSAEIAGKVTTPLVRNQDPDYTRIVIVTLAEATPVQEAADLQAELRRAGHRDERNGLLSFSSTSVVPTSFATTGDHRGSELRSREGLVQVGEPFLRTGGKPEGRQKLSRFDLG